MALTGWAGDARAASGDANVGAKVIVKAIGPLATKELMESLLADYCKGKVQASVDYARTEARGSSAMGLVNGRELALAIGKVTDRDMTYARERWKALAAEEHFVGARTVAVMVHARNPVNTLSMEQLQLVYSGRAMEWKSLGGESKAIRRYGLAPTEELAVMFHEKVLSAPRCAMIQRKKDSAEVLAALGSDPYGVAFVDAVAAASAGDSVKTVGIGEGAKAVLPNTQTVRDGSYPLSEALMLYVSPKAQGLCFELADFVVGGQADAICRRHGYMPALRSAQGGMLAAFEKLYGPDIKRARATPETADDVALAGQILQTAKAMKVDADLLAAMCMAASDLAMKCPGSEVLAFESLQLLREKAPIKQCDALLKWADMWQRSYIATHLPAEGMRLVEAYVQAADSAVAAGRMAEAARSWGRALAIAEELNSLRLAEIRRRQPAFEARVDSAREVQALSAKLRASPQDRTLRERMLKLRLIELGDPAAAAQFVNAAADEATKNNLPLACEPMDKLAEESALKLAEWCIALSGQAGVGGRELMDARAVAYYKRFFELHKARDDALATRASLGIQKAGGTVPPAAVAATTSKGPARPSAQPLAGALQPGEEITDLRLAELIALNPSLGKLSRQEVGAGQHLTNVASLARLSNLTMLELQGVAKVRDLSPLRKMTSLTSLTLTGLEAEDLGPLSELRLTSLDVSRAQNVSDLTPVGRLVGLQTLNLSGCGKVSDLSPLTKLARLSSLNLSGCESVTDISPLEKFSGTLTALNLNGCTKVADARALSKLARLRNLDLGQGNQAFVDRLPRLREQLPQCRISVAGTH
jgi:ABC-type phosphate transport system substrate-binding protein